MNEEKQYIIKESTINKLFTAINETMLTKIGMPLIQMMQQELIPIEKSKSFPLQNKLEKKVEREG